MLICANLRISIFTGTKSSVFGSRQNKLADAPVAGLSAICVAGQSPQQNQRQLSPKKRRLNVFPVFEPLVVGRQFRPGFAITPDTLIMLIIRAILKQLANTDVSALTPSSPLKRKLSTFKLRFICPNGSSTFCLRSS
jgi:hypothetical protein